MDSLSKQVNKNNPQLFLYIALVALVSLASLGLLGLWDSVPMQQYYIHHHLHSSNPFIMLERQLIWFVMGSGAMWLAMKYRQQLYEYRWCFVVLVPLLLALPFVPAVGERTNGSYRHIVFAGVYVRSGIWAVLLSVPAMATWLIGVGKNSKTYLVVSASIVWVGIANVLLLQQVDLPMLALFDAVVISMLFASSLRRKVKVLLIVAVLFVVFCTIAGILNFHHSSLRRAVYVYAYQNAPYSTGYQTSISVIDRRLGGLTGHGLGSFTAERTTLTSHKHVLPYSVTTMMLQITARQFGLCGVGFVVGVLLLLFYAGRQAVLITQDSFERLVKMGALMFLFWQAFFSIARTMNLLPFMPSHNIPFFGYGAHAIITAFIALGLLSGGTQANDCQQDV